MDDDTAILDEVETTIDRFGRVRSEIGRAIFGQERTPAPGSSTASGTAGAEPGGGPGRRAWEAWQRAQEALRRGDLGTYGAEQRRLEETLRAIIDSAPPR